MSYDDAKQIVLDVVTPHIGEVRLLMCEQVDLTVVSFSGSRLVFESVKDDKVLRSSVERWLWLNGIRKGALR